VCVTIFQWTELAPLAGGTEVERPVVMNRGSAHVGDNPFACTFCYGHMQYIFEVCWEMIAPPEHFHCLQVMTNGYLGSVVIYEAE
jgi:hypothetical protein